MKAKQLKNADVPAAAIELNGFGQFAPEAHLGLTKREMFAMHAMQGLLANSGGPVQSSPMSGFHLCNCDESGVAKFSVSLADALLNELEK